MGEAVTTAYSIEDAPAQSKYTVEDDAAPDLTSNPKGEGLYRMGSYDANQGQMSKPEIQVPYSRVADAKASGYNLHPDEAPRYAKDKSHEGQGPTILQRAATAVTSATEPLPDVPLTEVDPNHPIASRLKRIRDAAQNVEQMPYNVVASGYRGVAGLAGLPQQAAETVQLISRGDPQGMENLMDMTPPGIGKGLIESYRNDVQTLGPNAALANLGGNLGALYTAGKIALDTTNAVGPLTSDLVDTAKSARSRMIDTAVGTGPRTTAALVRDTATDNLKISQDNANAAQAHLEKIQNDLHSNYGSELQYQEALKQAQEANSKAIIDHVRNARAVEEANATAQAETEARNQHAQDVHAAKVAAIDKQNSDALQAHQDATKATQQANIDALQQHLADVGEVAKGNAAAIGITDARAGLQKLADEKAAQADVLTEKARHDALDEGNSKYNAVNPALNPIQADPEVMQGALADALESIKGSKGEPTILKDIEKSMQAEVPTYESLQGDYSRLGKELSKGTLPGDEYHAYDVLHEAIGNEMQRIADSEGMGDQLKQAREYWRRMKQTFGKSSDTVPDRAGKAVSDANPDLISAQQDEYRQRLLGSFDPQIPQILQDAKMAREKLAALPSETAARNMVKPVPVPPTPKPLPTSPELKSHPVAPLDAVANQKEVPNPPDLKMAKQPEQITPTDRPVETPSKTIGTEDIRAAKEAQVRKTASNIHQRALSFGVYLTGMKAIGVMARAMTGDLGALASLPTDVAEGVGVTMGVHGIATLLESPKVLKILTEPTARDFAEIPPELQGDIKNVVDQAQRQGIKVDPGLAALVGASSVPLGPKTKAIQNDADFYRLNPR